MRKVLALSIGFCLFFSGLCFGATGGCPQSDLTGDCAVNLADLAIMASEWLVDGNPNAPDITWVYISDPGGGFNGEMSKYETTNAQYCQYLNAAMASGDVRVENDIVYGNSGEYIDQVYCNAYEADSLSQISYSGGTFSVRSREGFDMSNHPVVTVSWYGAMSFAQYYGWWLPTQWEWQAVADHEGEFTYGCGTTIDCDKANYYLKLTD